MNYYNDNDKFCVKWLKALIADGLIPQGDVDDRSIKDISPSDLHGYTQHHFFAGIGGWSYALRLAGWPDDRPVWTGSCPCQPFSVAGKGKGTKDDRHLWPAFRWLIAQCRPAIVFGEQVASKAGRGWLAGVRSDLEAMGYAVGGADLCSAGVGAPNIRQRVWWVADAQSNNRRSGECGEETGVRANEKRRRGSSSGCEDGRMGNTSSKGLSERESNRGIQSKPVGTNSWETTKLASNRLANTTRTESTRQRQQRIDPPWEASKFIQCRDGKSRRIPVEPALFPLAPRLPGRVGLLRGAGNAINPWVAREFIEAYLECAA